MQKNLAFAMLILYSNLQNIYNDFPKTWPLTCISFAIGSNGKPLAAITKFSNAIGKLLIVKTLPTNGEAITNAMIVVMY